MSEILWALHPGDQRCHAVEPGDLRKAGSLGYAEALCGAHVPDAGMESADRPWGALCLPCAVGATADLPDPGRMGSARYRPVELGQTAPFTQHDLEAVGQVPSDGSGR